MPAPADNPVRAARQAIDACTDLTGRMLDAAEAGEWDTVAELDVERRPCFDGVDLAALEDAELAPILERLRALVAMDGRLSSRVGEARQTALEDLRRARGRARGSKRYEQLRWA
jgi:hypothetical protein